MSAANLGWMAEGVCASVDGDLWFPEQGASVRIPRLICRTCPVVGTCLEYAVTHDIRVGVWGGLTPNERRRLTRPAEEAAA